MPETTLYIRVKQAVTWLKRNKGILQKDIAEEMGITETSFTRGMARIKEKYDEDFVVAFHSAVSNYISLDYLLHGTGNLLVENEKPANPTIAEPAGFGNLIEIFSRTIRESDDLRVELKKNLAEVKALKDDLHQAVYDFRDATYRLTQALEQLNKNSSNIKPLNIAAEDDNQ